MREQKAFTSAIESLGASLFPGISSSQDGVRVDELALVAKTLGSRRGPGNVMVDVGAHFGSSLSWFVRLGWSIYAFEPDAENRAELLRRFGDLSNLTIDARAVSDQASDGEAFFHSSVSTGISSLLAFHESHDRGEDVEVTTLRRACDELAINRIDVLKVDVEGLDLRVLKGHDWEAMAPDVVVCEFEDRKTLHLGYTLDDLCAYLTERQYHLLVSEWFPVHEYGARHRFRRVDAFPTRRRDPDSWGNVIAARSRSTQLRLFWRIWLGTMIARLVGHASALRQRSSKRNSP